MSDYIVSARKYRPDTFESLLGQDNIAKTLKNSIKRGQLAHAYLFCGPRGVGKTSAARIFAKTINCSNPGPDLEPCGECESCRSFKEGRSYCIHELDAASNNGVEGIKTLMEQVQIPPQVGKYSVYIIDEVHMLTLAAFNAFLKTLEEPPAYAIFILATTEKHKIFPTILSRCQTYDFNRISIADMVRNISDIAQKEGITIDSESMHIIAHKADGAMRDALTIFDQTVAFCGTTVKCEDVMRILNVLDYEYCFRLVDSFLAGDYKSALLIFNEVLSKGFNAQHFVAALGSHLRDLLVSKTGGLESLLDFPDSLRARYKEQSDKTSVRFLYDALGITTQCEAGYRLATNQRLHIEFALLKLSFLSQTPIPATTVSTSQVPSGAKPVVAMASGQEVKSEVPSDAKPAPSPAPRRTPAKSGSSLSLSALMQVERKDEAPKIVQATEQQAPLPGDATLRAKWTELVGMYSSQPRLANALSKAGLTFSEQDGKKVLSFTVTNEAQRKWIEEKILRDLEARFCKLLSCTRLRLEPVVIPETEMVEKKYMPIEKAEELMAKNPEVKELVMDLSLDVK